MVVTDSLEGSILAHLIDTNPKINGAIGDCCRKMRFTQGIPGSFKDIKSNLMLFEVLLDHCGNISDSDREDLFRRVTDGGPDLRKILEEFARDVKGRTETWSWATVAHFFSSKDSVEQQLIDTAKKRTRGTSDMDFLSELCDRALKMPVLRGSLEAANLLAESYLREIIDKQLTTLTARVESLQQLEHKRIITREATSTEEEQLKELRGQFIDTINSESDSQPESYVFPSLPPYHALN